MYVSLITGAVPSETIDVLFALTVPNVNAFSSFKGNRHWPIVFAEGGLVQIDVELVCGFRGGEESHRLDVFRKSS